MTTRPIRTPALLPLPTSRLHSRMLALAGLSLLTGMTLLPNVGFSAESGQPQPIAIPEAMRPNMDITSEPLHFGKSLPVTQGIVHIAASSSGQSQEMASAAVSAPIAGQVVGDLPQLGQSVKAGEALVTLVSPQLAQDQAQWSMANAQAAVSQQNLSRDQALYKNGLIAKKRLEATRAEAQTAAAELASATARLRLAGVAHPGQNLKSDAAQLVVTAPIGGVVTQRSVIPGTRVTTGQPLLEITATNQQWWLMPVPPALAPTPGTQATLKIDGCPEAAPVRLIDLTVDPHSQMITLRAQPKTACPALRPGQIGTATLWVTSAQSFASVPITALTELDDSTHVFVQRGDQYLPIPVSLHGEGDGQAFVTGPFQAEDRVVTQGMSRLKALGEGMGAQ